MRLTLLVLLAVALESVHVCAADDLATALKQPILTSEQSAKQAVDFVVKRIPKLQQADSAEAWQRDAEALRQKVLEEVVFKGVPAKWREGQPRVEWLDVIETGHGYKIKKLRYEALPGLWIPALLYEPDELNGKVPAVLNVNGHDSNGKSADYKQLRCINLAKRGILALNTEWLRMGELRGSSYSHDDLATLDLCGVSGLSVFYLAMSRGLDVLTSHPHADLDRVAMTGLSGGGWQTIILSSLDTRIKVSIPVAGYSSLTQRVIHHDSIGDLEQNPTDLVKYADYVHLTALLTPRPALLIYNRTDNCCFKSPTVRPNTYEPVVPFYQQAGAAEAFEYYENTDPGTHNYELDNRQQLYRFLTKHWSLENGDATEIASNDEIMTAEELTVGVPANNTNFRVLAEEVAQRLPRELPGTADERRQLLKEILRWEDRTITGEPQGEPTTVGDLTISRVLVRDEDWSLPAVMVAPENFTESVMFIADSGFANHADEIAKLASEGKRVVSFDPVLMGAAQPPGALYQHAQLIATVGARPLGIQASQILAAVRLANQHFETQSLQVLARGPRSSLAALCADALDADNQIAAVETAELPETLKAYLREGRKYNRTPETYCFGLLEYFDLPQLRAMGQAEK